MARCTLDAKMTSYQVIANIFDLATRRLSIERALRHVHLDQNMPKERFLRNCIVLQGLTQTQHCEWQRSI
eukprot:4123883-Pleurochrysis_carterae.AAC.4